MQIIHLLYLSELMGNLCTVPLYRTLLATDEDVDLICAVWWFFLLRLSLGKMCHECFSVCFLSI